MLTIVKTFLFFKEIFEDGNRSLLIGKSEMWSNYQTKQITIAINETCTLIYIRKNFQPKPHKDQTCNS